MKLTKKVKYLVSKKQVSLKKMLSFIKKVKFTVKKVTFQKNPVKPWQCVSSFTQKCENKLKTPLTPD